jgi:hypothetical protein
MRRTLFAGGLVLLAASAFLPSAALGAERVVLGEEFSATW